MSILVDRRNSRRHSSLRCACAAAALLVASPMGWAAEPSATDAHQPGVTIGLPAGTAPPTGLFLSATPSFYDADMVDGAGRANGTHTKTASLTATLIWSTGWEVLGGRHYLVVNQPIVNVDVRSLQVSQDNTGLSGLYVAPFGVSWTLAPGIFASAGAGVYLPTGTGGVGNHFATFEPQLGFGYLRDGWNLSLNAFYDINSKSDKTHYLTGDRFYADITATKKFGHWEIGPVGYVVAQTTGDDTDGMAYGPFRPTFGKVRRLALGGLIGYDFGQLAIRGYVTNEVYARNGASGLRGWLGIGIPLWMDAAAGP